MAFVLSNVCSQTLLHSRRRSLCHRTSQHAVPYMMASKGSKGAGKSEKRRRSPRGNAPSSSPSASSSSERKQVHSSENVSPTSPTLAPKSDSMKVSIGPTGEDVTDGNDKEKLVEDTPSLIRNEQLTLPDGPLPVLKDDFIRRKRRRPVGGKENEEQASNTRSDDDAQTQSDSQRRFGFFWDFKPTQDSEEKERRQAAIDNVRKLTEEYRKGGPNASEQLLLEVEKDPDFMFQSGNATGEYDITAALIGTGKPNKQGVYVLPYLQSGHLLLSIVILICAFVYYPGFPLTELEDSVRDSLKAALALTYSVNSVLSVFSYKAAKLRSQPSWLWVGKTWFLGGLALQELRSNVPLEKDKGVDADRRPQEREKRSRSAKR